MSFQPPSFHNTPEPPASTRSQRRRVAATSLIGTAIEWYDFNIYGVTAALVFGPQFFPSFSPLAATLAAFATFGVGFVARPLGGIVMGHFGDRLGRKSMLVTSLMLMGVATFLIGVLPTYAAIGVFAPIALVVLRFVQGFGVGGEWGGAVLMGVEHAPPNRRTFYGSFAQMGNPLGIVLSAATFLALTTMLDKTAFVTWGWRVAFLASAALVIVGLVVRLAVSESPDFRAVTASGELRRNPLGDLLRTHPKTVLLAGLASVASPALGYVMFVFLVSYGQNALGLPPNRILGLTVLTGFVWIPLIAATAILADRIGRRPVFAAGLAWTAVWMFPFFALIDTASLPLMAVAYVGAAVGIGAMTGPQAGLIADLFPAQIRYSGASVAYQLGAILGGGVSPLIATLLIARTGSSTSVAAYLCALAVVSLAALLLLREPSSPHRAATKTELVVAKELS